MAGSMGAAATLPDYDSFVDALSDTLGAENAQLAVRFLEDTGAITGDKKLDGEKVASAIQSLFGENALAFLKLMLELKPAK
ncbi:MAG: hypothetical protein AB1753_08140 [Thermoproteota archaeon]